MMKVRKLHRKAVDEEHILRCAGMTGVLREEVWVDEDGEVVRYNLAFIHHGLMSKDNGRVLGYDNSHGTHHRHWYGQTQPVPFTSYLETLRLFLGETHAIQKEVGP